MAFLKDPPVNDRWDCCDFDGDPGHRRLDKYMDFIDGATAFADDGGHLSASPWATTTPIHRQQSRTGFGQPHCPASIPSIDWEPPQVWDPTCDMQPTVSVQGDPIANVQHLNLANMECLVPEFVPSSPGTLPESLSDFRMAFFGAANACLNFPTLRRSGGPDGIMKTLSVAV